METQRYVQVGVLCDVLASIQDSVAGDAVSIEIRRLSDGYVWDFVALAFAASASPGSMTFFNGITWRASFTPPAADTYVVTVTYGDLKFPQYIQAMGSPAPSSIVGTGLVSEAELESYLEAAIDTTLAETMIAAATDFLERECDRKFIQATFTEYIDGSGERCIWLKNFPVASITKISLYDQYLQADTYVLVAGADYVLVPETGRVEAPYGSFPEGVRNIKVEYLAGYTELPMSLKTLCMQLISWWINRKASVGVDSQTIGKFSQTFSKESVPPELRSQIDRFKRIIF